MNEPRLKILPPWSIYIKKIEALFDGDPSIAFNVDYNEPSITLSCNDGDKVAALFLILPDEYEFGNVTLNVYIDGEPSNRVFTSKIELFDTAFKGNPAYAYSVCPAEEGYRWFATYVVFKNCVVQVFADNLNDCHGIISCLYQDIAKELLAGEAIKNVYFNTDIEQGKVGKPLGEWP